ncbi:MAG: restriction endonuclease [Rhodospirillales bacterium]|nr:restriction endonuclease [Rhodospirillales bacterium]
MPVPDYWSLMLPVLKALADGAELTTIELRNRVAVAEGLTQEDVSTRRPSGALVFANRVGWALFGVERAGLIERVRRAVYRLTPAGEQLLAEEPVRIDEKVLRGYPAYVEWQQRVRQRKPPEQPPRTALPTQEDETKETPEETLNRAANELRLMLEGEVLDRVRNAAPEFLEQVVVNLLIAMGYGGGDPAMGQVTGRSGDGGIDGTIREDALGLDEIYVQAKKYADGSTVGESDLRNFAGAIDAAGTTKGVFVTTAGFTQAARKYVTRSPKRIVLIDGPDLARLMVQHNVGVRSRAGPEIKRIDEDYFDQEGI